MVTAHPDDRQTDDDDDDGLKASGLSHLDKPVRMRITINIIINNIDMIICNNNNTNYYY